MDSDEAALLALAAIVAAGIAFLFRALFRLELEKKYRKDFVVQPARPQRLRH